MQQAELSETKRRSKDLSLVSIDETFHLQKKHRGNNEQIKKYIG